MASYTITACSTADLSRAHFDAMGIPFACFHYTLDGVEYADDLGVSISFDEFYRRVAEGAVAITAQVNEDSYYELFSRQLDAGQDVLHICLSSGISGSINSARLAAKQAMKNYPGRRVEIVDSLGASSGFGLLLQMLADKRDTGATLDEVRDYAEELKLHVHHWFFSTDLTSYIRGGRISRAAGLFGQVLGICPLLNMDNEGHLIPREKVRTKKRVIKNIFEKMLEHAEGGTDYDGYCYMCNSACYEDARAVADLIEAAFPKLRGPVEINTIGTTIGSHTGCGTVALFFVGDKRVD